MRAPSDLVSRVFRTPDAIRRFSIGDWDSLVSQARQAGLLARMHHMLQQNGLAATIPSVARWHFDAAATLSDKRQIELRGEVQQIRAALARLDFPLIVLNCAADVMADLPAARGRLFSDIDFLVPHAQMAQVESALALAGWYTVGLPDYDQHYYHRWMLEITPMQHVRHATVIDVHHAILPESARYHPDSAKLRNRAVAVQGLPGVAVLAPEDRVLHAATQLFHNSELAHGLLDLSDIDLLLRKASTETAFWMQLLARAEEMHLSRPLFYALRYAKHFFATPVPDEVDSSLLSAAPHGVILNLMDCIFTRALAPAHPGCEDTFTPLARNAAKLHAHLRRRPQRLLIPHLFHKAFISAYQRDPKPA